MDGTMNGEFLFECQPGHGTLLRPTQVKLLDGTEGDVQQQNVLAPKIALAMNSALEKKAIQGNFPTSQGTPDISGGIETNEQQANRSQQWKNKIEELRKKKQQEAQLKSSIVGPGGEVDPVQEEQKQELKQLFQPSAGISRAPDGKLAVNQEQAQKPVSRFTQRNQNPQQETQEEPKHEELKGDPEPAKKPIAGGLQQKLGAGPQKNQTTIGAKISGAPATATGAKPAGNLTAAVGGKLKSDIDDKKEKLQKMALDKAERINEKKDSLPSARQPTQLVTGGATSASGGGLTNRLGQSRNSVQANALQKSETMKTGAKEPIKPELKKSVIEPANPTPKEPGFGKPATASRPLTARQEPSKGASETSANATGVKRTTAMASKLGSNLASKVKTGSTAAPSKQQEQQDDTHLLKNSILEVADQQEEDHAPSKNSGLASKKPTQVEYLPPTDDQIRQFMMASGQVSEETHKKVQDELRKKNDEVFSLQLEVRSLFERVQQLQQENATALELMKTEYEIKLLELEQQASGSEKNSSAAAEHAAQLTAHQSSLHAKALADLEAHQASVHAKAMADQEAHLNSAHAQALADLEAQYKQQFEVLQNQHQNTLQESHNQLKQLQSQCDQLRLQKTELDTLIQTQKKDLQQAELDKRKFAVEIEAKSADIEIIQLELEALKDEKEELINQIKMASEMQSSSQEDMLAGLSEDELKGQNQKLRQAIATLSMNFEVEKSRMQSKIGDLSERNKLIEDYEKKLEEMDFLVEEVDLKEQERAAMEEKLNECLEFEKMVEEMAEEILNKEEEIDQLLTKIKELEENVAIQEELNENQDEYIKELNEDIANKEAEVSAVQNEKVQLEELVLEADQNSQRYKEKLGELGQKCQLLQDELQSAYAAGDVKVKVSTLIDKQNNLIYQLRDANKKESEMMIGKIHFWQEKMKAHVIEGFIPTRLQDQSHLDSLEKIMSLNIAKQKALLLLREICEKQLTKSSLHEDQEQSSQLIKLLVTISESSINFIDSATRIIFCLSLMTPERYVEITTKMMAWSKLSLINQFCEKILDLLKEESLVPKFDISIFLQSVKSIQELRLSIENKYTEKAQDEENSDGIKQREKDLQDCSRSRLRNELVKIILVVATLANSSLNPDISEEQKGRCKLIYWRVLDIIYKIDFIPGNMNGNDFLNLRDLGTDTRLENKYHMISQVLWGDEVTHNPQEKRDWQSVLEAIERDITSLSNDYKFKKLIAKISDETQSAPVHIDDIYTKGWDCRGPWNQIVDRIRKDLEDTESMKDKIDSLQEKSKDQAKQHLLLKREKDELAVVNQSIEARLSEALHKVDQIAIMEMDKKRIQDREIILNQEIERAKKEIENFREKEKEYIKKIEEAEINSIAQTPKGTMKRMATAAQTPIGAQAQHRQSRASDYFKQLSRTSLNKCDTFGGGNRATNAQVPSTNSSSQSSLQAFNSIEVQKQIQMTEDTFAQVIFELQKDRMAMKGQKMMEKLKKFEDPNAPMTQFISRQREKQDILSRFTRDEQKKLEGAVNSIEVLKTNVKKEMALIKVIDLTKKSSVVSNEEPQKGNEESSSLQVAEKINYMIVKAKDQVNDAFNLLFSKDSSVNQVKNLKETISITQEKQQQPTEMTKIASLRIQGLPIKKVISLTDSTMNELKKNLAVFAQ